MRVRLLEDKEVPAWVRSPFIKSGYRPIKSDYLWLAKSTLVPSSVCSAKHNELVNTWTHLLALFYFIYQSSTIFLDAELCPINESQQGFWCGTRLAISFYLLACLLVLSTSVTYHTLMPHSEGVCDLVTRGDYSSIGFVIGAAYVAPIYLIFEKLPWLRNLYLGTAILLSSVAVGVSIMPATQGLRFRLVRVFIFMGTVSFAFVPLIHVPFLLESDKVLSLYYMVGKTFVWGLVGTFFYVKHFPEKVFPRTFDIVGQSHQIWHIATTLCLCQLLNMIYELKTWQQR